MTVRKKIIMILILFILIGGGYYLYKVNSQDSTNSNTVEENQELEERKSLEEKGKIQIKESEEDAERKWTKEEALTIAKDSAKCSEVGTLKENIFYNENSKTWWIDLDSDKKGCNPACVVYEDGNTEVNWRCTGLIAD